MKARIKLVPLYYVITEEGEGLPVVFDGDHKSLLFDKMEIEGKIVTEKNTKYFKIEKL